MKISCIKENLYKGLLITGGISSRNTTLPILNNVLLKTDAIGLTVSATNLEVGVITKIRGKVQTNGSLTVQGKLFTELISLLPNEKVDLEVEGVDLKITCAGHQTTIHGLAAEDFPVIPEVVSKKTISVGCKDFAKALEQVAFAANPNENRPEISGVLLDIVETNKIALVATDSYRLAEKIIEITKGGVELGQIIIPLKTIQQVVRVINTNEEAVEMGMQINDNQIMWNIGETLIVSRIITAQFPDYKQIIPKKFNTELWIDRMALLQAVKSASLFTRAGINDVRLQINPSQKNILISAVNSQLGEDTSTLMLNKITGEANEIVFNYRYLLDGLNAVNDKEIKLSIVDTNNPGLLKSANNEDYSYIIMPIRQ
ncbi:MAG: DNA polymerase III subunit beta [Patescibacteria group bacterium]